MERGDGGMMRYTKDTDWVEISGAADIPIADFDTLYGGSLDDGYEIAHGVIDAGEFAMSRDRRVTLGKDTPVSELRKLSKRQWLWLRERIMQAMKDEDIDPEA